MPQKKNTPKDGRAAILCIYDGIGYFWKKSKIKTMIVLFPVFGQYGYLVYNYATSDSIQIERAEPIVKATAPQSSLFNFSNIAIAGEKVEGRRIMINGQYWGMQDTSWDFFKLEGEPVLLIHERNSKDVGKLRIPSLTKENVQQQIKKE